MSTIIGPLLPFPATTRSKSDPNYIGAWWLGFLIIGLVIMVALIPLFFFPKHMKHYRVAKKSRLLNQQTAGDTMAVKETDGGGTSVLQQFKGRSVGRAQHLVGRICGYCFTQSNRIYSYYLVTAAAAAAVVAAVVVVVSK